MAEEEIAKHTKKIYETWLNKNFSIWHKLGEFLVEILIIVFAVSISIWFHNRSEHAHQQEDVRVFLDGLKGDLTNDIAEMESDKKSYEYQKALFSYFTRVKIDEPLRPDTLKKYWTSLLNTTELNPNDGRFEGFKSSGKIGTLENKELQNDIMSLYEEDLPALLASTKMYVNIKMRFFDLFYKALKRETDSTTNIREFLKSNEVYTISGSLGSPNEVLSRYDQCIMKMKKIVAEINALEQKG